MRASCVVGCTEIAAVGARHVARSFTTSDLKGMQTWRQARQLQEVEIRSWLDDETSEMYGEWKSASSELERKKLCQKWRLAGRLHGCYPEPP